MSDSHFGNQKILLSGLDGKIEMWRDQWGIPHVQAKTSHDAFFAQGFSHAQDRLWQMDSARRRMQGRWAEWVGPSAVPADTLVRRIGAAASSQRDFDALKPETRAMLQAYTEGVNAYLELGNELPKEYELVGGAPEPWLAWHSIAAMRQRGYLMGSIWFKLWRAAALNYIDASNITKLRYDDGGQDLLCIPPGAEADRLIESLSQLQPSIEALALLGAADATGGGSNNWAISPSRTATGRPLLAGDPHRAFEMPGMYSQAHLACDEFDAIGLTVPGVPGFPHFAHNGSVAWCVTHAFVDIHDLFVERFRGDASKLEVEYKDQWLQVQHRSENIQVKNASSVSIDIYETQHGPIICGDPLQGCSLALRSVQFIETDSSFDCLLPMLSAQTVDNLFEATKGWGLIDHNLVAADTTGRIGHLVRANAPDRPSSNGWLPVPGWTGAHDWKGMIPWEQMPRTFDPARGYIVTANNRIVSDHRGSNPYLCTDCHPPYRAKRIETRLEELSSATVEDMKSIHGDVQSLTAPVFQNMLDKTTVNEAAALQIKQLIVNWDGKMDKDSISAAAYSCFRWQLAALLAERSGLINANQHALLQLPPAVVPVHQLWWALPQFVRANDNSLLNGWTWEQTFEEALKRTAILFNGKAWGLTHQAALKHPLGGISAEAVALLDPPGLFVGGDNDTVMANGCIPAFGLAAAYGAVARYVFDVGNWDQCQWIVIDGSSGNHGDPHRMDQHALWAQCEMVPMLYNWKLIHAKGQCTKLEPIR